MCEVFDAMGDNWLLRKAVISTQRDSESFFATNFVFTEISKIRNGSDELSGGIDGAPDLAC
jgi:hypothetical protein